MISLILSAIFLFPGAWLSWLERRVHIAEVAGSIPAAPNSINLFFFHRIHLCMKNTGTASFIFGKNSSIAFFIAVALSMNAASNDAKASVTSIQFIKPEPWTQVRSNPCTLAIDENPLIQSIVFKVQYMPENTQTPQTITLGEISRPPYTLLWDIAQIPNQLSYGVSVFADIFLTNDKTIKRKLEGVFLAHHAVVPPAYNVRYSINTEPDRKLETVTLSAPSGKAGGWAAISWNEKFLTFHIQVNSPHFCLPPPENEKFKELGVKICLDARNTKNAYLTEEIALYVLPLDNKPYTIVSQSVYEQDGSFDIIKTKQHNQCRSVVKTEDFKGYSVSLSIPQKMPGFSAQQTIGCNIIATTLDEHAAIQELSWIAGNSYTVYSPFSYGDLVLQNRPFAANRLTLWIFCFIAGLLLGILSVPVIALTKKFNPLTRFEKTEQEDLLIKNIVTILDAEISNKNFTLKDIASKLSAPPEKVDRVISRFYGKTFKKHLLGCRIEIVKERLRSSNASEISIAGSCGFSSIEEMEKAFRALNGMSPYAYREKNRIA